MPLHVSKAGDIPLIHRIRLSKRKYTAMKLIFFCVCLFFFTSAADIHLKQPVLPVQIFSGGIIEELESIFMNITYSNFKKYIEKEGYQFEKELGSGSYLFSRSGRTDLVVETNGKVITELYIHMAPIDFYNVEDDIEANNNFKKIFEKTNVTAEAKIESVVVWRKSRYLFYADDGGWNIGILLDKGTLIENYPPSSNDQNLNTVHIVNQYWASANLTTDRFKNGDQIPQAETAAAWKAASEHGIAAWCYYKNDKLNGNQYGKLYNWFAVTDEAGLAPKGWHIPSQAEASILINNYGGYKLAGNKLKSVNSWLRNGGGDNTSRFNALPAGLRWFNGDFSDINFSAYFWTSTSCEGNVEQAHYFLMQTESSTVFNSHCGLKGNGYTVRCLQD